MLEYFNFSIAYAEVTYWYTYIIMAYFLIENSPYTDDSAFDIEWMPEAQYSQYYKPGRKIGLDLPSPVINVPLLHLPTASITLCAKTNHLMYGG